MQFSIVFPLCGINLQQSVNISVHTVSVPAQGRADGRHGEDIDGD
jgi:hypothetical protein